MKINITYDSREGDDDDAEEELNSDTSFSGITL